MRSRLAYSTNIFFRQSQVQYCVLKCAVATSTRLDKRQKEWSCEEGRGLWTELHKVYSWINEKKKKSKLQHYISNLQWRELVVVAYRTKEFVCHPEKACIAGVERSRGLRGRQEGRVSSLPFFFKRFSPSSSPPSPFCMVCHAGYTENAYSALTIWIHTYLWLATWEYMHKNTLLRFG